jgi:hypothetical protein
MFEQKNAIDSLKEGLFYESKHVCDVVGENEINAADDFSEGYMEFMNEAKTEREAVAYFEEKAKNAGYVPLTRMLNIWQATRSITITEASR